MNIVKQKQKHQWYTSPRIVGYLTVVIATTLTITISWILYQHTVNILTNNLRERLIGIVNTAAVQFDIKDLNELKKLDDYKKPEWSKVVKQLIKIRKNNNDIVFAYILRKSPDNLNAMDFIADSHSLDPFAKVDLDNNGIIDDADALNWPGEKYQNVPEEAFQGYERPVTNKNLYTDQWGTLISGYSPIKGPNGNTEGIMAIDVRAGDFLLLTRQTFYPFMIFIIGLVIILLFLANFLIYIWDKQIKLIADLDRQKDELLGIVSHQLATPVTSISWYLEMLLSGDVGKITEEQSEHLKSSYAITKTLSDLVSMILDVSRIQLGRVRIDKQKLDMNEFFKQILQVVEPKAKGKGLNFAVSMPPKLPVAMLDSRYTRMTIENLLTNAIKYTPANGNVNFTLTLKDGILHCTVQDSGCGIPKAEQDKIFGKLFRASNVRNNVDGNGFGLYVAKGAVEAQGGKIWFESTEGKGTTFFVELPISGEEKK